MTLVKRDRRRYPWFTHGLADWFDTDKFLAEMPLFKDADVPAMNVKENKDHYEVELAVPGFSREDIEITLDNDMLKVAAEKRKEETEDDTEGYTRKEFSYNKFERRLQLPTDVDPRDEVMATYQDGILKLILSKKEEAMEQPTKRIEIA